MTKIVINRSYGGFHLSPDAIELYAQKKGIQLYKFKQVYGEIERDDPALIEVVQEIGGVAGSEGNNLVIVEIPDDVEWEIEEYDGLEWVSEKHRIWAGNG